MMELQEPNQSVSITEEKITRGSTRLYELAFNYHSVPSRKAKQPGSR